MELVELSFGWCPRCGAGLEGAAGGPDFEHETIHGISGPVHRVRVACECGAATRWRESVAEAQRDWNELHEAES